MQKCDPRDQKWREECGWGLTALLIPAQECSMFTVQELEHQMKPVKPGSKQAKGSGSS